MTDAVKEALQKAKEIERILQDSVFEALEKKRRLGQYAVLSVNGRPKKVEAKDLAQYIPKKYQRKKTII